MAYVGRSKSIDGLRLRSIRQFNHFRVDRKTSFVVGLSLRIHSIEQSHVHSVVSHFDKMSIYLLS